MRRSVPVCLALLLVVLAIALTAPDGWAKKKGPRCSPKLCREGITACVAFGEKRRACERGIVRACKVVGPGLCLPPTTTTTIPPVPTTLDVAGVWALSAVHTLNTCAIDVPASLDGQVTVRQNGSVLSGDFGFHGALQRPHVQRPLGRDADAGRGPDRRGRGRRPHAPAEALIGFSPRGRRPS